ncbi:MAG: hypothetical protein QM817_33105 [Archangium sp.]
MLPAVGDVLQFEVKSGVALLFRVVAEDGESRCVVLTRWTGKPLSKSLPRAASMFEVQPLKHHAWDRPMIGGWVSAAAPSSVKTVGRAKVKSVEAKRVMHPREWVLAKKKTKAMGERVLPVASWDGLLRDARAQWRWDHERELVLEEESRIEVGKAEALNAYVAKTSRGVKGFIGERFFETWDERVPSEVVKSLEALMQRAAKAIDSGGDAATNVGALVDAFFDVDYDFDELDQEELLAVASRLARAAGLSDAEFESLLD